MTTGPFLVSLFKVIPKGEILPGIGYQPVTGQSAGLAGGALEGGVPAPLGVLGLEG